MNKIAKTIGYSVALLILMCVVSACGSNTTSAPQKEIPKVENTTNGDQAQKAKVDEEAKLKAEQELKVNAESEAKAKAEEEAKKVAVVNTPPPQQTEQQNVTTTSTPATEVYYKNCTEVKAAGVAPLYKGQPGYRSGLDRDGDGCACEK